MSKKSILIVSAIIVLLNILVFSVSLMKTQYAPMKEEAANIPNDKTYEEIISIIMNRMQWENHHLSNWNQKQEYQKLTDEFYSQKEDLEFVINEINKKKDSVAIIFNADVPSATTFVEYIPKNKSVVLNENGLSFRFTSLGRYLSIKSDPKILTALNAINKNEKVSMILRDDYFTYVKLEGCYFNEKLAVEYRYSKNSNGFAVGKIIDEHWSIYIPSIMDPPDLRLKLWDHADNEFPQYAYQNYFKEQTEEYKKVVLEFQNSREKFDLIIGNTRQLEKGTNLRYFFLGEGWKRQLDYIPDSDFLRTYNDSFFVYILTEDEDVYTDESIYNLVKSNEQLYDILNQIGKDGKAEALYFTYKGPQVSLIGPYFKEKTAVELYDTKEIDRCRYKDDISALEIGDGWLLYVSMLPEGVIEGFDY